MLWLVAIDAEGGRARRYAAEDAHGALVRAGGSPEDDLVLPGCDRVAEIVHSGGGWLAKTPGAPLRPVADGARVPLGAWRLFLFIRDPGPAGTLAGVRKLAEALAAAECEADLPRLVTDARPPLVVAGDAPLLVGTLPSCDLRIRGRGAVVGIVRRTTDGAAVLHPCGGEIRLGDGSPAVAPVRLRDGDLLHFGDGVEVRYEDPQEAIDAILAGLEGAPESPPPRSEDEEPVRRWRLSIGDDPQADVSVWEIALWCAGALAAGAFTCVYLARL